MKFWLAAVLTGPFLFLSALSADAQSILPGDFDPAIPTLEEVTGHRTAEAITDPAEIIDYVEALQAAAPDRMQLVQYAESWEGRPLVYAVISAPENMARLPELRANMARLADGPSPAEVDRLLPETLPVTWLSYGVHGNEISSSDAGLALAYHLLAARGDERVETILDNSIVVIDPAQNPDGRARFVHSFEQALGLTPFADPDTAEHDEPWPGGRYNHYLFDLNRDWFAVTQPETVGKVAAVRDWNPVALIDAHEMGGNSTYFFPPSADPFNPNITEMQKRKQELLGRNHAAWFDSRGEPYFTREVYDAFYPGYGDSWPTLTGSIAMTFEQASARGLLFERNDGSILTYGDGVANHFIGTLSTAETVARNADQFLRDYAAYRRTAAAGEAGRGTYLIDLSERRWNAESLARRLVHQGIEVTRRGGAFSACGKSFPEGALMVDRSQPEARLIRSLLDENTPLPADFVAEQEARRDRGLNHRLYDVTAWSLGLMSGLDVTMCSAAPGGGTQVLADAPIAPVLSGSGRFGMAVPWSDTGQARLVFAALAEGLNARATGEAFRADGQAFPRGTVVFPRGPNDDAQLARLSELAAEIGAEVVGLASGWVEDGPNLGSGNFVSLAAPRIAMAWDDGIAPTSAGALRYVIERRLGVPVAPIRTARLSRADLGEYDVLLLPSGYGPDALGGAGGKAAIQSFADQGGVVVAIGGTVAMLAEGEKAMFATARETALGGEARGSETSGGEESGGSSGPVPGTAIASEADYRELTGDPAALPDEMPGALLNTAIDPESLLSAGYGDGPVVLVDGSQILTPLNAADGTNVVRFAAADDLLASGYVWDENRRQLAFKPYMMAQRAGSGLAIGFAYDPATRGYLDGLDLLIANSLLFAPASVR
ncbi:carboxypeptidase [Pacificimonas flava]|uniref:Carboxypeptidase n=2 Tax=Pacificimonas TaxID=1960290 RepID=A0A219B3Z4_9SPHN|nr:MULTISPECIES: M14 family zinc carboxypeptidase [Pacificimonas]MBZ6377298.1 carboxypeptidase [Pacificimonas aurantium]OWV32991.1 carboxypeptidase [Pacificimonas flava]